MYTLRVDLNDLNSAQKAAVAHKGGPILVIAGAGTGKTEVIVRRMAYLIKSGLASVNQILALTFTDKAAGEMENRLIELIGYVYDSRIMTFNSYGEELLHKYGLELGYGNLELINQSQQRILISQNFDRFKLKYFAPISSPERHIGDLAKYFSKLKSELISPKKYLDFARQLKSQAVDTASLLEAAKQQELAKAFSTYIKICRGQGLIDFDDQVGLALELFKKRRNVLKQEQSTVSYILVDEFQDTNLAQSRLLYDLSGESGNLMVVGDDDQSIYKFRGAAISNILGFKQVYPKAKTIVLTKNYRSTQAILDASYRLVVNNNPDRLEAQEKINKHLTSPKKGRDPLIANNPSLETEANFIASDVKHRIQQGLNPASVAILIQK